MIKGSDTGLSRPYGTCAISVIGERETCALDDRVPPVIELRFELNGVPFESRAERCLRFASCRNLQI